MRVLRGSASRVLRLRTHIIGSEPSDIDRATGVPKKGALPVRPRPHRARRCYHTEFLWNTATRPHQAGHRML